MPSWSSTLSSSIGSKAIMAATGLAILLFVVAHLLGNLQVFLGPEPINRYAAFLKSVPEILWAMRIGLAVVFVPFRQGVYEDEGWWAAELRWKSQAIGDAASGVLAAHGVPFLDLTSPLARRARSAPPLYHQGEETHPTPDGYRAIAEEVAAWLEAAGALSAR